MVVLLWNLLFLNYSTASQAQQILVLGDSLSTAYGMPEADGWVALLTERVSQRKFPWRVHNASISGETTAGGRSRIDDLLSEYPPDIVLIGLGGNDGLRGLGLNAMRENLDYMIDSAENSGAAVLLMGILIPPNYGPVYSQRFASVFSGIAEQRNLDFLPFLLDGIALEPDMMLDDGIHPSRSAQPGILENVWTVLEPMLERLEEDQQISALFEGFQIEEPIYPVLR